jgi:hypothetical protein
VPERLPVHNISAGTRSLLELAGIHLFDEQVHPNEDVTGVFARYTIPKGWKVLDSSWSFSRPIFFIVDEKDQCRFNVSGKWHEMYDSREVYITVEEKPYPKFKSISNFYSLPWDERHAVGARFIERLRLRRAEAEIVMKERAEQARKKAKEEAHARNEARKGKSIWNCIPSVFNVKYL